MTLHFIILASLYFSFLFNSFLRIAPSQPSIACIADGIRAQVLSFGVRTSKEAARRIRRMAYLHNSLAAPSPKQSIRARNPASYAGYLRVSITVLLSSAWFHDTDKKKGKVRVRA